MRCFYHDGYYLPLPRGHPFPMEKFRDAYSLLKNEVATEEPSLLPVETIELAHHGNYLRSVNSDQTENRKPGLSPYARNRLGLPAHPRLLERSMLETSGTVAAAFAALGDGISANLAGGTHHAFPGRGLGFCVLNDVAVAVEALRAADAPVEQILIVDTDAHQGNGNHAYFAADPCVHTFSIHVGRNYPAEKVPGDWDAPLERQVGGETYLSTLRETLPPIFEKVEPDLVFWIAGADSHEDDRFGQMRLTREDLDQRDHFVLDLCEEYASPTAILYGGGYNRRPGRTGAIHAQTVRTARQRLRRRA